MTTEIRCPNCAATQPVTALAQGSIRCLQCGQTLQLDQPQLSADDDRCMWRMKTPEGQTYGPASLEELTNWVRGGRVTDDCQLSADGGAWMPANLRFPELTPQLASTQPTAALSRSAAQDQRTSLRAHRGPLILVMSLVGWVTCCPLFTIAAWVMGTHDLNEMRAGRVDKQGISQTYAGQVLGMVHAVITIIVILVAVFVLIGWTTLGL